MSVRVLDCRLRGVLVRARLPFRFGIAELRELVHVVLFATVEVDGAREVGVAADHLAPKWFTKNPETSYRDDAAEMIAAIEGACEAAGRRGAEPSVFDLWHGVYRDLVPGSPVPLLASFGVSLVERAAIDAFCRARTVPFAEAVRRNDLGLRLEALHAELKGRQPGELLPSRPLTSLRIRHTVGLGDALVEAEGAGAAPPDGLPATLEGYVRRFGLRRFKVKVAGRPEGDLERLSRVGEVLDRETRGDYRVTLDGNEQFKDVAALRAFWDALATGRRTGDLARRVDYVEHPCPETPRSARTPPRRSRRGPAAHASSSTSRTTRWTPSSGRSPRATTGARSRAARASSRASRTPAGSSSSGAQIHAGASSTAPRTSRRPAP